MYISYQHILFSLADHLRTTRICHCNMKIQWVLAEQMQITTLNKLAKLQYKLKIQNKSPFENRAGQ